VRSGRPSSSRAIAARNAASLVLVLDLAGEWVPAVYLATPPSATCASRSAYQTGNRAKDVVIDLPVAATRADTLPEGDFRDNLLDAADIIRPLKIILDGKPVQVDHL
jgi:hypothetical protein